MKELINELLYLSWQQDEQAAQELLKLMEPAISLVYSHELGGCKEASWNEWQQEACSALYDAIFRWRPDREASFSTYYRHILTNRARDMRRRLERSRKQEGACVIHLDALEACKSGSTNPLEALAVQNSLHKNRSVMDKLEYDWVKSRVVPVLSEQELVIWKALEQGESARSICRRLCISRSAVLTLMRKCSRLITPFD